jgi:hypothetical protein
MLAERPQVFLETMQNLQYAYRIAPEPLVAGLDIGRLIEQAEDVVSRAATSPVLREVSGWLLDVVVFLVTAGAALVVAISAIHIGDTFGTFWDYLKLIAVSITAPVVGVAALEAVGRFRLLRSDPLLRSEAEPAQVTT